MSTHEDGPDSQPPKQTESLKSRALSAGSWAIWGHFSTLVLRFLGTIILTRIFSPTAFGILAVVTAIQIIITLLTDIGLRQAVIQSSNGSKQWFLNTAWTMQILRGGVITLFGSLFAAALYFVVGLQLLPTDSVYTDPNLPAYIVVASFSAIILGFQSMKWMIASRDLQLKRILFIELSAQLLSLAFVVILGWYTRSLWAYVGGLLLSSTIIMLLSHGVLSGGTDRFGLDRRALTELLHFGRWTFLSSMLTAFSSNGDRLMLGAWVNAPILGLYSIAYNLANIPDGLAGRIFGSVAFPALSEAVRQDRRRLPEIYFRMRWITDSSLLFASGFLFATGSVVIKILYDQRYASAGWMLECLSLSLFFARYGIAQNAYLALGRPDYVTVLSVTKLISLFVLVPSLFYSFGLHGAIIGIAIHMLPVALWTFHFGRKHQLNNMSLEFIVLLAWVLGWLVGSAVERSINAYYFGI